MSYFEDMDESRQWICNICGYGYMGKKRKWTCPDCGNHDSFEKEKNYDGEGFDEDEYIDW